MKKKKKNILWRLYFLAIIPVLLLTQSVLAGNTETSGVSGTCSWTISDGTLSFFPTDTDSDSCKLGLYVEDAIPEWAQRSDVTKISLTGTITAHKYSKNLFRELSSLTDISALTNLDVSCAEYLTYIFSGCSSLTNLSPLSQWQVSNVSDLRYAFQNCSALKSIEPLENWEITDRLTSIKGLFENCSKLESVDSLSNWNVSSVTDMKLLFSGCSALTSIAPLSNWNVTGQKLADMKEMLSNCSKLKSIAALSDWDVSSVKNMNKLFNNCSSLTDLTPLSGWDVSSVEDMSLMFYRCNGLTDLTPLSGWNVSNVISMPSMFSGCSKLKSLTPLNGWIVSSASEIGHIFQSTYRYCSEFSNWNLSDDRLSETGCKDDPVISSLKVTVSGTTASLSWSKIDDAESYTVFYRTKTSSNLSKLKTVTAISYSAANLTKGLTYYFKVQANLKGGGCSDYSPQAEAYIGSQVTGMKSTVSGTSIKLSWNAFSGAKSYVIERSVSKTSGFKAIGTPGSYSYTDKGLSYGKTYYYRVRAVLANSKYSQYSNVLTVKVPTPQVSGLTATLSGTTAKLKWSKLSDAKTYYIYRSTSASSNFTNIGKTTSNSYSAKSLKAGKTYFFKVRAKMSNGEYSAYSSVYAVGSLTGLEVSVSGNTAKLKWSKLSGVNAYYIYRSTSKSSGFKKIGTASSTSYSAKGLDYDKTYYFKVRAKLSSGNYSAYSSVVKAYVLPQVSGLKATAKESENIVKLKWTKLSGAKTYYIYRSTSASSGFKKIDTTTSASYSVESLSYGKTYYFKVRAKLKTGDYSNYSAVVKAAIPPQVKGLQAKLTGTTVKLTWTKLPGAKSYDVQVTNTATGAFTNGSVTTNSAKIAVGYGKSYSFKVRAKLSSGYSAYSDAVEVTVKVPKKAAAVSASRAAVSVEKLSASVSGQSVKLSWEKLSGAKSYEIYRSASKNSGYEKIGTATKASYEAAKQGYGQTRYYKVRALLSDKTYSEYSSAVKAVIPAAPTAVPTVVPTRTAVPTAAPVQAEDHAANITEECSADGSSCTIVEKVCTETECTITSKVCVVVGDQRACADPVVTVVPVLTETPVVTETAASEVTPTVEATATEMPAVAEVTEECSEDGSSCTVYEKVCTETECTVTSRICVVVGDQRACSDPVVTVVPVLTETPVQTEEPPAEQTATEESPKEPAVTEEVPTEPAATEGAPAEPTATEEVPAEPAVTEEAPAEPAVTEEAPAEPTATEEVSAEPTATEEVPAEPAVTEEAPAEPAVTEETPAEPTATEEAPAEPTATEEAPAEPTATEEAPAEPAVTEEAPAEPAVTEEVPAEPAATEEVLAESVGMDEVPAEPAPTEDLTIREISIADLTENTINFSAQESYTIAPERLKVLPEAADWTELQFKLDDESVAAFKSTDVKVIRAEGLTIQGLQPGSTTLRIQTGEIEKTVTLNIDISAEELKAATEAADTAQKESVITEE